MAKRTSKKIVSKIGRKVRRSPTEMVSSEILLDFLSEFLAVEKGGVELYTEAFARSSDPEIKKTYGDFLKQTKRHAELLTAAIRDLGGEPDYLSPGAEVQQQRAQSMLGLDVPEELQELADAENLLLAETKDHADWEFLDTISSKIEDEAAREIIKSMVDEIEDEEDKHLKFAKQAVDRLTLKIALSERVEKGSQRTKRLRRAA